MSAEAPPAELFRPLLAAALDRGVTSTPSPAQVAAATANGHTAANGHGANSQNGGEQMMGYGERALLAEEVLVYQRAATRLAALTDN